MIPRFLRAALAPLCLFVFAAACATPSVEPVQVGPIAPARGEQVVVDHSWVLVDSSASVSECEEFPEEKALLRSLVSSMPEGRYQAGTIAFGGVRRDRFELAAFDRSGLAGHAAGLDHLSEGTPLYAALGEAGESLAGRQGLAAITVLSDGAVTDPFGREVAEQLSLDAARAAADAYDGNVCIHTIQIGNDPAGAALLADLAATTGCGSHRPASSLRTASAIQDFQREVYLAGAPVVSRPGDRDGDGVADDRDRCPRTPRGAQVDGRGCWVIQGLTFATDSAEIDAASRRRLEREVVPVITDNPGVKLRIDGHTDSRGAEAYNQQLSELRARAVRDFLVSKGVPPSRLSSQGFGETRPVAPNDTAENLRKNRRTELTVVGEVSQ